MSLDHGLASQTTNPPLDGEDSLRLKLWQHYQQVVDVQPSAPCYVSFLRAPSLTTTWSAVVT